MQVAFLYYELNKREITLEVISFLHFLKKGVC